MDLSELIFFLFQPLIGIIFLLVTWHMIITDSRLIKIEKQLEKLKKGRDCE